MGPALLGAILVMPVFGGMLFAANSGVFGSALGPRLIDDAALCYTAVLVLASIVLSTTGNVTFTHGAPVGPVALALVIPIGIVLTAVGAYLVELVLSDRLDRRGGIAAALPDIDADDAVQSTLRSTPKFAAIAVVTAAAEEVVFRGGVLPEVAAGTNQLIGVLASAILFAFHHIAFGSAAIIGKFMAGIGWGSLYLLTGGVIVPFVAHLLFQALVFRRLHGSPAI